MTTTIMVVGHPATGKTTLAHRLADDLKWPLVWKDGIKEPLMDALPDANGGWSTAWSNALGRATIALLYQQVETLLRAQVAMVVECHFEHQTDAQRWQSLHERYPLRMIQVRCETDPSVQLARYQARIEAGERHPGHVNSSATGDPRPRWGTPVAWIDVPGPRLSINTSDLSMTGYGHVVTQIKGLINSP